MKSMTGYGQGIANDKQRKIIIDLKSVNGKFLDINIKMSKQLMPLEDKIKKMIQEKLNRGTVDVYVTNIELEPSTTSVVKLDMNLASNLVDCSNKLAKSLKLDNNFTVTELMKNNEVVILEKQDLDLKPYEILIEKAMKTALDAMEKMRTTEGKKLKKDLTSSLKNIETATNKIKTFAPVVVVDYKSKLKKRITDILQDVSIDESKLLNEVAYFADKADINEEIIRLLSHIDQINGLFKKEEPIGKKLEFLSQEITREANTIGSKANYLDITNLVLTIKNENEKLKEQTRNVE